MPVWGCDGLFGDYYLENVRLSGQTRTEMPWGDLIPDELFRHFVLPIRVNNENLDDSRRVFYGELKDRVKHLSMKDAILEVNHWCHEKVVYRPSDARTSSPLASVKTAYGALRRRIHIYCGCVAFGGDSGKAGIYSPLGTYG